ncbi:MAG: prepilin-type N-terminal cleavage/methylation domain-containing protein [Desulfosporosinus sp.]|jgi:prepilin-type N-terminal cleavage/methylation domain-containing protein
MRLNRESEGGFTLLEVLLALLITGILLMTSMRLLTDQWRGARALKNQLEAHYSVLTAGKTVSDAIRMAQTAEWVNDAGKLKLKILPMPADSNPIPTFDSYFLDDKDGDGTQDLYWEHLKVPQPLASYIVQWQCTEVEPGLWEVFLEASVNGQRAVWHGTVLRRTYTPVSPVSISQPVMPLFLSSSF